MSGRRRIVVRNGPSIAKLEPLAQAVLDARAAHPGATLADLYDPDLMPPNLRKAHQALDRAVDRLYRRSGFAVSGSGWSICWDSTRR